MARFVDESKIPITLGIGNQYSSVVRATEIWGSGVSFTLYGPTTIIDNFSYSFKITYDSNGVTKAATYTPGSGNWFNWRDGITGTLITPPGMNEAMNYPFLPSATAICIFSNVAVTVNSTWFILTTQNAY